ncbi:C-type lectin lectoxin-Lio2-like [Branchiostoma floridae]|uniref:C-type lectin lectoxin-Lio2-like n=1 Tax=Branchiostoma floridae TaxID=7739 RepID=A0A9J7LFI7_BRAFL|nr:C-type lectin lectoxin-Lio2-like [Branchiostoma floridae]
MKKPTPCRHGKCMNRRGRYKCSCSSGWTGPTCQRALRCSPGWKEHNNYCYMLVKRKVGWSNANDRCKIMSAHLASVKNSQENNFIASFVTKAPEGRQKMVWLGLTGIHKKGPLMWTDGSRVVYKNWAPGEPNNLKIMSLFRGEHCGAMYIKTYNSWTGKKKKQGHWNDAYCDEPYPFVCKARTKRPP